MNANLRIEELDGKAMPAAIPDLAEVLSACVTAGASVGFVWPFSLEEAAGFWRELAPAVQAGSRRLLVARLNGKIVGTVHLVLASQPNGRHRAEISKLLVHPDARRRGAARALMRAAETLAHDAARSLLVLDTASAEAASLYKSLGFAVTGVVPGYARATDGALEGSTFMHKTLPRP